MDLQVLLARIDAMKFNMITRKRHGNGHCNYKRTSMNMRRSLSRCPNIEAAIVAWMVVRRCDMSCEEDIILHDSHMRQAPDFLNRQSTPVKAGARPCTSEIGRHATSKYINKSQD